MNSTTWECQCGQVRLRVMPAGGSRVVCYCDSCRDFVKHLDDAKILDQWGGNDLFQIAPEAAEFVKGAESVVWTQMTKKGPARWFTSCCNTPFANTLSTRTIPFLTLQSAYIADPDMMGPIEMTGFCKFATGDVPKSKSGQARLLKEFAIRSLKSRLSGGWRQNPLFDSDGKPIAMRVSLPGKIARQSD